MPVLRNYDHERFCQELHKRIWAGEKEAGARLAVYQECIYRGKNPKIATVRQNAAKMCQRADIKQRLAELKEYSAQLVGLDASWAMLKLKGLVELNLDDFLGPADGQGYRYFDLADVPPEKIGLLSELSIESAHEPGKHKGDAGREIRKIRLKGSDKVGAIALMARIAGWEAPKRTELTGAGGAPLLEQLVGASYTAKSPDQVADGEVGEAPPNISYRL